MAHFNSTSATANSLLAFQRSGSGLWRIGDVYNGGPNYFELYNTVLGINAMQVFAATNKTSWQATETYTTGLARGNYFDYNLSVSAGGSFSSPNAITALGASLDLTLAGNATIPSGARSGLDAYNSISFTGTGTLTHNQGTQIRAYSNLTAGWSFNGSAVGTITHLAGLRALFPDNSGSAVNVTNNYALLLNDQTANTGTVTYTNRWGIYQEGASDLNYMAANLLLGSTTNSGERLQVTGSAKVTGAVTVNGNNITIDPNTTTTYALFIAQNAGGYTRIGRDTSTGALYGDPYASLIVSNGSYPLIIGTNDTERVRVTSAGLFGIGTSAPVTNLDVNAAIAGAYTTSSSQAVTRLYNVTNAGGINSSVISFQASTDGGSSNPVARVGVVGESAGSNNGSLVMLTRDGTGVTEKMRINSNGYILTNGLTSPVGTAITTSVQIKNASGGTASNGYGIISANNEFSGGTVLQSSSTNAIAIVADPDNLRGSSSIDFFVDNAVTSRMRVNNTGNVLIGTTTDGGAKLAVNGAASINTTTNGTFSKLNVAGAIHFNNNTDAVVSNEGSYGNAFAVRTSVAGSSATTIKSNTGSEGALYIVSGLFTNKRFCDIVISMGATLSPVVVSNTAEVNTPATRTYTVSGENLQLTLSGSDTYTIYVTGFGSNEKN